MFRPEALSADLPFTRIRMARTFLGRPLHEVSAYRVGDLLVDCGPPPTAGCLADWCREAMEHAPIDRVVLTHHHEDHVGGAAALREALGLPVFAPVSAVPILAEGLRMPLYRRVVWGSPRRVRPEPLGEEVVVRLAGEELRFAVVPTPGHAFDHVCLWEPFRRWLISGDLYVHPRVKYLRRIEDAWVHLASLRRVLALGPEILICAHAGLVRNACAAIEAKIAWWEGLAGEARALRDRGWPVRRITRRLLGREGFLFYASFGDFAKGNLVRSLLAGPPPTDEAGRGRRHRIRSRP